MSRPLDNHVAVVLGASRGAGRGIALALGDAGAAVYVAGRTTRGGPPPVDGAPGTIDDTADEVTRRGGRGVAVRTDATDPASIAALFERVGERVDLLACASWSGNERVDLAAWGTPFHERSPGELAALFASGPFAYHLAAQHAARRRVGLIVMVTDGVMADGTTPSMGNLPWDLAHRTIDHLAAAIAAEGVPAVAVMPGFMRTERVVAALTTDELKRRMRFDLSESVEYLGRAVAALAAAPDRARWTGRVAFVADLARAYGVTDVDGTQPPRFNPTG
jgi:NAD(P)-dependent dehydrogenase (short-subunit alcohol dehydrogenase family)